MKTMSKETGFGRKVLVIAMAAAFAPAALAEEESVAELIRPASSVSVGLGGLTGGRADRSIFGQYNGLRRNDAVGLFDIDFVRRDDATGTWMIFKGSNLSLDTREISASYERQGDWKVGFGYDEITHREIRTVNTGDTGVGGTTPSVVLLSAPGGGWDVDLKVQRKIVNANGEKWLTPSLLFEFNFRNEDKDGARFSGKGYDCATYVCNGNANTQVKNAILMQAEPINTNTKQLDMKLVWSGERFSTQFGYYGSIFNNENGAVNMTVPAALLGGNGTTVNPLFPAVAGGTSLQNVLQLPFALPPDNQAHQLFAAGTYAFTNSTKANFKLAYTQATQNDSFAGMGLSGAPAGVGSLDGKVNTTLAYLGFTTKPISRLTVNANVRYEEKEDKTPKYLYNIENTARWYNADISSKRLSGKLEGTYQLPENFRATLGVDYKELEREVPTSILIDQVAGLSALREKNRETGYRAELSRVVSDTLSGSIAYSNSERRGSDWTALSTTTSVALRNAFCGGLSCYGQVLPAPSIVGLSATSAFPLSMADINREKWKLAVNWSPVDPLSVQFFYEHASDRNVTATDPVAGGKGYRANGSQLYGIDLTYALSDNWQLTAYASRGRQTLDINHSTGYLLNLENDSDAFGLGLVGKVFSRFDVGANLAYLNDSNHYGLRASPSATGAAPSAANLSQAAIGLPDVVYRQTTFNLFGKYALDKKSDIRADLVYQNANLREWSWGNNGTPFVYADNTTVTLKASQSVTFLGVRYIYKF